jgi:hypothetical protein
VSEDSRQLDEARARAGDLVSLLDILGEAVDADVIERAALVPLSPEAVQAVFNLGCLALMNMDTITAILAGCCSEERIAMFASLGPVMSVPKVPARRPRRPSRPRPTAADRARLATEWLADGLPVESRRVRDPQGPRPDDPAGAPAAGGSGDRVSDVPPRHRGLTRAEGE